MGNHIDTITAAVGRLNDGDVAGYMEALYHPHCRFHGFPEPFGADRAGIATFFHALVEAVPDTNIAPEDVVADGNRVAIRFRLTGTHRGELLGAAATGNRLDVEGITILRFEGDLVAERWNRLDDATLVAQLTSEPVRA